MAVLVGLDLTLGIVALVFVPPGRPSGLLPDKGSAFYLAHSLLGLGVALGAVTVLVRVMRSTRLSRLSGWIGAIGVAIAAAGGVATVPHPFRIIGIALMGIGSLVAGFGYLIPTFEKLS